MSADFYKNIFMSYKQSDENEIAIYSFTGSSSSSAQEWIRKRSQSECRKCFPFFHIVVLSILHNFKLVT